MSKEKKYNTKNTVLMILTFIIGIGCGAVATTLLHKNDIPVIQSSVNNSVEDNQVVETTIPLDTTIEQYAENIQTETDTTETTPEVTTITTITEATTTEATTTKELPTPQRENIYPDLVVEKVPYAKEVEGDKVAYITFDDGPWSGTPEVLDLLDEYNVKATFFVTAQFFENEDDLIAMIKQIHDRGHVVAVHTYSHEYHQIYNSVEDYLSDYKKMDDIILKATGERSHVFRFPGGSNAKYNREIREDLIREMNSRGFVYHDWNSYDGGCDGYSIDNMISTSVFEVTSQDKGILLMHDTKAQSFILDTLPSIITQIRDAGYRFDVLDGTVKPIQFATVDDEEEIENEEEETQEYVDYDEDNLPYV